MCAKDFPRSPLVKTLPSNDRSVGSISGQGAKILHTSWPKKTKHKIEAIFNKFNKYFKSGPHAKKKKKKDRHVPECKKICLRGSLAKITNEVFED